jgi:hypothetical protein
MRTLIFAILFSVAVPAYAQLSPAEECVQEALAFAADYETYLETSGAEFLASICERRQHGSFSWGLRTDCATGDPNDYNSVTFLVNSLEGSCYRSGSTYVPPCNTRIFEVEVIDQTYLPTNQDFASAKRDIAELCRFYEPPQ